MAYKVLGLIPVVVGETAFDNHIMRLPSNLKQLHRSASKVPGKYPRLQHGLIFLSP